MISLQEELAQLIPETQWKRLGVVLLREEEIPFTVNHIECDSVDALFSITTFESHKKVSFCNNSISYHSRANCLSHTKVWLAKCDQVKCFLPSFDLHAVPGWLCGLFHRASVEQIPVKCFVEGELVVDLPSELLRRGIAFCTDEDANQRLASNSFSELIIDYEYDDSCVWRSGHIGLEYLDLPFDLLKRLHLQCEEADRLYLPIFTSEFEEERYENWSNELFCLADEIRRHFNDKITVYVFENAPFSYDRKMNIKGISSYKLSLQAKVALQNIHHQAGRIAQQFSRNRT